MNTHLLSIMRLRTLTLFLLMLWNCVPRPAFGDVHFRHIVFARAVNLGEIQDERDPNNVGDCLRLGELDIGFNSDKSGLPTIGIVLTDPRARRIGFDPLSKHTWQELPEAEGYIDCDGSDGRETCKGIVHICGPLSGTYKVEVIARETSHYTVSFFARSEEARVGESLRSANSKFNVRTIAIRKGSRDIISLTYSRDPDLRVAAQLEKFNDHR